MVQILFYQDKYFLNKCLYKCCNSLGSSSFVSIGCMPNFSLLGYVEDWFLKRILILATRHTEHTQKSSWVGLPCWGYGQTWKKARTWGHCPQKFFKFAEIFGMWMWKIIFCYFQRNPYNVRASCQKFNIQHILSL